MQNKTSESRILTLDIETAALESYTWGIWDVTVGLDMIKTEWSILSYAAKWLDSKRVMYADTGGRGSEHVRDDKQLVGEISVPTRTIWRVLDAQWVDTDPECDVIVVGLQADGKIYAVTCSGPKGMRSPEFISALHAAAASLIKASGGDTSIKVVSEEDDTFYTGDQLPN